LLDAEPDPSRERIREAISGNLCRCTGYLQIYESIEEGARRMREGDACGDGCTGAAPASVSNEVAAGAARERGGQ
jgi:carbon-monoxide dehydrogenase small subunit